MNIYQIKKALLLSHQDNMFFSRSSMKWAGQTLKDFQIRKIREYRYLIFAYNKKSQDFTKRVFDSRTGRLYYTTLPIFSVK